MTTTNQGLQKYDGNTNSIAKVDMTELKTLGALFYESQMFTDTKSAAQAMIKILAGQQFGFDPITSMSNVYIINGKPVLSATAQASLIKSSGRYDFRVVEHTDKICKIEIFKKSGDKFESWGFEQFSFEEAKKAGLIDGPNKHNWGKYPKNMLFARCMTNTLRFHCSDLLRGSSIGDAETPEMVELSPDEVETHAETVAETAAPDLVRDAEDVNAIDAEYADVPAADGDLDELRTATFELLAVKTGGEETEVKKVLKGRDISVLEAAPLQKLFDELKAM